jgi:hypothetical protein
VSIEHREGDAQKSSMNPPSGLQASAAGTCDAPSP